MEEIDRNIRELEDLEERISKLKEKNEELFESLNPHDKLKYEKYLSESSIEEAKFKIFFIQRYDDFEDMFPNSKVKYSYYYDPDYEGSEQIITEVILSDDIKLQIACDGWWNFNKNEYLNYELVIGLNREKFKIGGGYTFKSKEEIGNFIRSEIEEGYQIVEDILYYFLENLYHPEDIYNNIEK